MGYEELIALVIGVIVMQVTEWGKNLAFMSSPLIKILAVCILAGLANLGLAWFYLEPGATFDWLMILKNGMITGLAAVITKSTVKTIKETKK